jgi:hypothetical protein
MRGSSPIPVAAAIEHIPFDIYRGLPGISQSTLKPMLTGTPGQARYRAENRKHPSRAMVLGTAVDRAVYEGDPGVVQPPAELVAAHKKWKASKDGKAWLAEHKDDLVATDEELTQICGAAISVMAHPVASMLLDVGHHQLSLFWEDEVDGEPVARKGRPDTVIESSHMPLWLGVDSGVVVDLKTCGAGYADREKWARHAADMHYDMQLADYCAGLEVITGDPYHVGLWIVVEMAAPHRVEVYRCGTAEMERGRMHARAALDVYTKCERADHWPNTTGRILDVEFPPWAMR